MNVHGTCQYFLSMMMSLKSAGFLLCFWRGWDCTTQGKRRDLGELTRKLTWKSEHWVWKKMFHGFTSANWHLLGSMLV